jgi:hypothetical protein
MSWSAQTILEQKGTKLFRAFVVSGFRDLRALATFDATRLVVIRAGRHEARKPEMNRGNRLVAALGWGVDVRGFVRVNRGTAIVA